MRRRKTAIFFLVFGILLSALAVALNVGWILLNVRQVVMMILGIIFFALIITGLILNTIFLVREIRRNEQHDAFLNAVTHELKTPIASIRLYLETLKSRDVSEKERAEFYDIMLADSDRLLTTVNQVLRAGSVRERRRLTTKDTVDITGIVEDAASAIRSRYNLADDVIRVTHPSAAVLVQGDADELETAFLNVLDNAVKYSTGSPDINVRIRSTALNRNVVVRIKDNGVGIPESELKRIFRRFHRVQMEGTRETKGTGLGLFLVKSIIEKHGGGISAESRGEGEGATFLVHLPIARSNGN